MIRFISLVTIFMITSPALADSTPMTKDQCDAARITLRPKFEKQKEEGEKWVVKEKARILKEVKELRAKYTKDFLEQTKYHRSILSSHLKALEPIKKSITKAHRELVGNCLNGNQLDCFDLERKLRAQVKKVQSAFSKASCADKSTAKPLNGSIEPAFARNWFEKETRYGTIPAQQRWVCEGKESLPVSEDSVKVYTSAYGSDAVVIEICHVERPSSAQSEDLKNLYGSEPEPFLACSGLGITKDKVRIEHSKFEEKDFSSTFSSEAKNSNLENVWLKTKNEKFYDSGDTQSIFVELSLGEASPAYRSYLSQPGFRYYSDGVECYDKTSDLCVEKFEKFLNKYVPESGWAMDLGYYDDFDSYFEAETYSSCQKQETPVGGIETQTLKQDEKPAVVKPTPVAPVDEKQGGKVPLK